MRKGILALTKFGKGTAKKKAKSPEQVENQTVTKASLAPDPVEPTAPEKLFVQTIQVPKPGTVHKKSSRKSRKIPYKGQ